MSALLPHTDLDQLRRQAKDLLRAAQRGDAEAHTRIAAVSERLILSAAQLAIARQHGFPNWARLKLEVERRQVLDSLDAARLRALLVEHPDLATEKMIGWCDHPKGATPLGYVAMMRYCTTPGEWRDLTGTGDLARELLRAGAPVDAIPGDPETPLMTAASYGDAEVARVLVEAGASMTATAAADAGGVPLGNALRHAAVFGMTEVAAVLRAAGASDLVDAAATGSVSGLLTGDTPEADRVAALRIAAEHGQFGVADQLLAAGTPIDGVDRDGSTALHAAAYYGRVESVRYLLDHGADPNAHDMRFGSTPLGWSRAGVRDEAGPGRGHDEVDQLLAPWTSDA